MIYSKLSFCCESLDELLLHEEFMKEAGASIKSFSVLDKPKIKESFSPSLICATFIGARNPKNEVFENSQEVIFATKKPKLTKPLSLE